MKLLFIGSLINDKTIDKIVKESKIKPSNAPVYFENMLIKGLEEAGLETTVVSVPTVSTYPRGCIPFWGRRKETLNFGKEVIWIPCINLLGVKQFCVTVGSYIEVYRWAKKNKRVSDKVIMTYSVYPPYTKAVQVMGKFLGIKTCCMVTDLPEYLYVMSGNGSGLRSILNKQYSKKMKRIQSDYDLYIFLTEHMAERMHVELKPAMLMEGFADESTFARIGDVPKCDKKTVMYAGRLSEDFNIRALLDGFMMIEGDYRLWLFGSGDMVDYIRICEKIDNRIQYFGKVERNVLLEHQKAAHLLVSVKSPNEDHANYAFPSKILEYMTSGTAVASTTVGGIPKDYFDYIYAIEEDTAEGICESLERILALDEDELIKSGEKAKEYALTEKLYSRQGRRIVDFLACNK